MANKRRTPEDVTEPKPKRLKTRSESKSDEKRAEQAIFKGKEQVATSVLDFPRGGGTPIASSYESTLDEGVQKNLPSTHAKGNDRKHPKQTLRGKYASGKRLSKSSQHVDHSSFVRIEHLNYKRIVIGMKLLVQVVSIRPLSLIVALPNQLLGHIPLTQVSSTYTRLLDILDQNSEIDIPQLEDTLGHTPTIPQLSEMFYVGQFLPSIVSSVRQPGNTEKLLGGRRADHLERSSQRVELSINPSLVNEGILSIDTKPGFTLSGAVKSIEDHGYLIDLGVNATDGFLPFAKVGSGTHTISNPLPLGTVLGVCVTEKQPPGRTLNLSAEAEMCAQSRIHNVTTVSGVLPGILVQGLVTSISANGLALKLFGSFNGTIDAFHLPPESTSITVGSQVIARVIYGIHVNDVVQFGLSMLPHVVGLDPIQDLEQMFPIGTIVDKAQIVKVEPDWGAVVSVANGVRAFVHIAQLSDDHVASLLPSSGNFRVGSWHRARVTGHHHFDRVLQLSFRESILNEKFLRVSDIQVGERITGNVKKLTDSALFVSISATIDGVIWPDHYADIPLLHPQKRFKESARIDCRVLAIDTNSNRIVLTAKKSIIESSLPIVANAGSAIAGIVTHGVVSRVLDKGLLVEFYNHMKAFVPLREISENWETGETVSQKFPLGKPVKVVLTDVQSEGTRITASIRRVEYTASSVGDSDVELELGQHVSGLVIAVDKNHIILTLDQSSSRGLLSLKTMASRRRSTIAQLATHFVTGKRIEHLTVVSKNKEKGIAVLDLLDVSGPPTSSGPQLSFDTAEDGQEVVGKVVGHARKGTIVRLSNALTGVLHVTDVLDDFDIGQPFPPLHDTIKAKIVGRNTERKQVFLSTRLSRLQPNVKSACDPEITDLKDLQKGMHIRGFVKSVSEHGLYVTIGRDIDARVQIKELFDEYVKDWKPHFRESQVIKGSLLSINMESRQVEMTLKCNRTSGALRSRMALHEFEEGQLVEATVKKIETFGLFLEIGGTTISGLCHKSEISDRHDVDTNALLQAFREGDTVKAIILTVNIEKARISFGLKPSYLASKELDRNISDIMSGDAIDSISAGSDVISLDQLEEKVTEHEHEQSLSPNVQSQLLTTVTTEEKLSESEVKSQNLLLSSGFDWCLQPSKRVTSTHGSSLSDWDHPSLSLPGGRTRISKHQIEQDFSGHMHTRPPESAADYERLLLGSPNSSYLWIRYLSFQLQMSELDKAREISTRALQNIHFREDNEKLNIWLAMLNMENTYGTEQSLSAIFKEAVRANDSKVIHLRLARIYEQSQKTAEAYTLYEKTIKKYSVSSKVWTLFGDFLFRNGDAQAARNLLPRSLRSLEKRKHIKTITKFAQLEFKLGDPERGRTIFEGVVQSHPKRLDLWWFYIDMEASHSDIIRIRALFDRVLAIQLSNLKAKNLFKKWLHLEHQLGDEESVQVVKEKAIAWQVEVAGP